MSLRRRDLLAAGGALLVPALLPAPMPAQGPRQGLDTRPRPRPSRDPADLVARAGLPGRVAYALGDGTAPIVQREAGALLPPASTMKAITAIYALDRLGRAHRFRTRIIRAGDMLILAGGGDPVLSTDDLATLADDLVMLGRTRPARFAVWGGALPHVARIAPEQAEHLPYNPTLSGLMLNFNRVHLGWSRVGVDHQIAIEARAAENSPPAHTITARPGDHPAIFTYRHDLEREYWTVARAAMGRSGSRWLPVRLPELYAADVFQTLCRARGLVLPTPEVIETLPEGQVLVHHDSPPLEAVVRDMLRYSTNITAEAIGLQASGAADPAASGQAMRDWLGAAGQGMRLADHSGLAGASRVSPHAMIRVLAGPGRDLALSALLRRDPLADDDQQIAAPVAAKTGTLNFVSNLAGYVTGRSGAERVFAILCADPARRAGTIGQELPEGVGQWTRHAKALQADLVDRFAALS